jgi:asparagine synthase (glutamine-hydrolysing)
MAAVSTYRIIIEKQAVLMSGIFGFVNFDGRPANPEEIQKMAGEMAHWGPDGVGSIIQGSAAMGHAHLIVTHESPYEKMPYHDTETDILFTAAARLDNRDELCDLFGIGHPQRPTTPDGRLVWLAWRKWGTDSCRHIFGDWSFAAWDKKEKKLFLARDHLGNTGLYYYFKPPLIVFASNVKAVLAHQAVPCELDEIHLGRNLGLNIPEDEVYRTYWQDVHTLPAAHTVSFGNAGKTIENFWRMTDAPDILFSNDQDYLEGFLDHFRRAVRVRLNSIRPVASTLSAGLDSSAVTALAAQELKKRNQPLVAYTSVPLYSCDHLFPGNITDEWPLAHQVAELYDNIEHIPVPADDITPLSAIKRGLEITHVPQYATANMIWIISLFEKAKARGAGVMLTGQLGNGGVSWSGGRDYIFYLFMQGELKKGYEAIRSWKKYHGHSWYKAVRSHIVRPLVLPAWSEYQKIRWRMSSKNTMRNIIAGAFVEKIAQNHQGLEGTGFLIPKRRIDPATERYLTIFRNGTMVGPLWHSFSSFYNMDVCDPTADIRLVEYCQGVPPDQDTFQGGTRMLIRRSIAGIIPDFVRWNVVRGKQCADITGRVRENHHEIEQGITRLQASEGLNQYVDMKEIEKAWNDLQGESGVPREAALFFLRVLNIIHFVAHRTCSGIS